MSHFRTRLFGLAIVFGSIGCAPPEEGPEVEAVKSAQIDTYLQITRLDSQMGGNESIPEFAFQTANRHGGNFEFVYTLERNPLSPTDVTHGNIQLILFETISTPNGTRRGWLVPGSVRGTTQTIRATNSGASDSVRVMGSRSCEGICGGQAPECWCDSLCTQFGDCCYDKLDLCGG